MLLLQQYHAHQMQQQQGPLLPNPQPSTDSQIRQVRLRKQLQFLAPYDYVLASTPASTTITIKNLFTSGTQGDYSLLHQWVHITLPAEYPFRPPTIAIGQSDSSLVSIAELIDEWSPRYKVMEMVELVRQRLRQKMELEAKMEANVLYGAVKAVPVLWLWVLVVLAVKVAVGLGSYSGSGDWPSLGDFEAHRNWMSITVNKPIQEWYRQTAQEPWWRIDYPPVAAYLSWLFGQVYNRVQPQAMALQQGYEHPGLTAYMRATVLLIDLLFLTPALYLVCCQLSPLRHRNRPLFILLLITLTLKPDVLLIDHGHFQYNSLMLGLILYSFYFMLTDHRYLCCVTFTLAINCKLMSVYYSLAFMAALLGLAYWRYGRRDKGAFVREGVYYGVIVVGVCVGLWLPWLGEWSNVKSVLEAIFPVHRGLYQLKVPNFWCISDVVMKWQSWLSKPTLTLICFLACLLASAPSMLALLLKPSPKVLVLGFTTISLTFFLFSYHVHQKSILLPLAMAPLLSPYLGGALSMDMVVSGCAGMYHLLKQDGQQLQYFVMLGIYIVVAGYYYSAQSSFLSIYGHHSTLVTVPILDAAPTPTQHFHLHYYTPRSIFRIAWIYGALIALHVGQALIEAPAGLPYLWNLLFAVYGFSVNVYAWGVGNGVLVGEMLGRGGLGKRD